MNGYERRLAKGTFVINRLHPVNDSEWLDSVGYDVKNRVLLLVLKSGRSYAYFDCTPLRYAALMNAPSMGAYVNQKIKGRPCAEVPAESRVSIR